MPGVDPLGRLGASLEAKRTAAWMLQGRHVGGTQRLNDRLLQAEYIRMSSLVPEVVVLGSSRSLAIDRDFFPGKRFFNHSVMGAQMQDFIALLGCYWQRGWRLERVIFGVDPWLFNAANDSKPKWRVWQDDFFSGMHILNLTATETREQDRRNFPPYLFSTQTLRLSLDQLNKSGGKSTSTVFPSDTADLESLVRKSDGSLSYPRGWRLRGSAAVDEEIRQKGESAGEFGIKDYKDLDANLQVWLEALVARLREQQTEIIIFLPPYHPLVYARFDLEPKYRPILEAENWCRRLAGRHGLKLIGSYDPERCVPSARNFYDGIHPTEETVRKIFVKAGYGG